MCGGQLTSAGIDWYTTSYQGACCVRFTVQAIVVSNVVQGLEGVVGGYNNL